MAKFCYLRLYLDKYCFITSVAVDGKDEVEPTFSGVNAVPVKITKVVINNYSSSPNGL